MVDWLIDWLIDWFDWLIDWLVCSLYFREQLQHHVKYIEDNLDSFQNILATGSYGDSGMLDVSDHLSGDKNKIGKRILLSQDCCGYITVKILI